MRNNVRPHYPSPPLPQELIDLILEQLDLDDDMPSLFSCLTVSKAFFPMARAGLWRDRFLYPDEHGSEKWTVDKIPESPLLRSLIRSMRICHRTWSFADADTYEKDLGIAVEALQRVDHLDMDFHALRERMFFPPAIRKWHIVSLKLKRFPVSQECAARSCAFFEDFPMLADVDFEEGIFQPLSSVACTMKRHHALPSPTSLTLSKHRGHLHIGNAIQAGHLISFKKLRSLKLVRCLYYEPSVLLALGSRTIKELAIDDTTFGTPGDRWEPLSFGTVEAILFSVDAMHGARNTLIWWTRTFVKNFQNNIVQKVTIEIQLYLDRDKTAPQIRFQKVWKELGMALLGLMALKDLVIIHRLGYTERVGDTQDASIRAGVAQFLRKELRDVTSAGHVRLTFIDRNV